MAAAPDSPHETPRPLEFATLVHVGVALVATTWAFGGNAAWVQVPLAVWASLGLIITAAGLAEGAEARDGRLGRSLLPLWPLALFNALVLISCLSPGFRIGLIESETLLIPRAFPAWRPSAALPGAALRGLWIFDGSYLTCFNLALVVRRRSALRGLLLVAVANALALAVFGTIQKLSHATGLFFGHFETPQPYFFASFVYDNHWGAFMVLMTGACLGLTRYYSARMQGRGRMHDPSFAGVFAVLLLAATVPLSGSRSCTLLMALLLGGTLANRAVRIIRRRREARESAALAMAGLLALAAIGAAGIWYVAGDVIHARVAKTMEQVAAMRAQGGIGSRSQLYRDTWRMARERLWFGWGMDSYPHVFVLYNRQQPNPLDHLPVYYHDAHSDWLQSAAEHGLAGTALLALCAGIPLRGLRRCNWTEPLPALLFAGCALVLLYAWIEFPFGNTAVVLTWWFCFFCALRYARLGGRTERPASAKSPA